MGSKKGKVADKAGDKKVDDNSARARLLRVLDSELGRSAFAVPLAIILHITLAKHLDNWPTLRLLLLFIAVAVPAAVWVLWPGRFYQLFRKLWSVWRHVYPVVGAIALFALVGIITYWLVHRTTPPPRVRFTCDTWVGWAPLFVAREKGFFGDTTVEFVPAHGSGEKRTFVYRGDADAIGETIDMFEFSSSASAVAPGVILWAVDRSNGADAIVASSEISSIKDLTNKQVGLEIGTPGHYMLVYRLGKEGLPLNSPRLRDFTVPDATEEFVAGNLDAAATWYPHLQLALKRQGSHVLLSSKEMTGDYSVRDIVAFTRDFITRNPNAVRDVFIGWCAALIYLESHPIDAKGIMAKGLNVSVQELDRELMDVELYGYEENLKLMGSDERSAIVDNILGVRRVWNSAGLARQVDPIETRVSWEVVQNVSKQVIDERLKSIVVK